jgi:hypothetical protein
MDPVSALDETKQAKRIRGGGSLYRPKYRTKDRRIRQSPFWWIKYYRHGIPIRENSHSRKKGVAGRLLQRRLGEIQAGVFVGPAAERLRYEELKTAEGALNSVGGGAAVLRPDSHRIGL